jgi:hypothetical protein
VCGWHSVAVPFTVGKAALDRYAAGLDRDVALDLRGALAWFGADEEGADVCVSRACDVAVVQAGGTTTSS